MRGDAEQEHLDLLDGVARKVIAEILRVQGDDHIRDDIKFL